MLKCTAGQIKDLLNTYGRTFYHEAEDVLYFNWTASTLEFTFYGTHLNVTFCADCGYEIEGTPMDPNAPKRPNWPIVGVFLDDMPQPIRKFQVDSAHQTWLVYQSDEPQTHEIRLTKLTENNKTFLGIRGFTMEGEILPTQRIHRPRMEIVGDSITCGYGNLVKEPVRHFFSQDEDGWNAYGPAAARKLGFEFSCISVSGITAVSHKGWFGEFAMDALYPYTDRVYQSKLGLEAEEWDFAANPNDYVVVNLGTNDCFAILFSGDDRELDSFSAAYEDFIRDIRRLNGPDTHIICALGTMNYYLYHDIAMAVERICMETGDEKLHVLRFKPILPFDGLGADGHPAMATHEKMAEELASFIHSLK